MNTLDPRELATLLEPNLPAVDCRGEVVEATGDDLVRLTRSVEASDLPPEQSRGERG